MAGFSRLEGVFECSCNAGLPLHQVQLIVENRFARHDWSAAAMRAGLEALPALSAMESVLPMAAYEVAPGAGVAAASRLL